MRHITEPGLPAVAFLAGLCLFGLLMAGAVPTLAQDAPGDPMHLPEIFDLSLGAPASAQPEEEFIDYACGTGGGPPGKPVGSFLDYADCPAEASGLHEIAFRYDDELAYRLLARGMTNAAETNGGTRISVYPIFASALFDGDGILRGLRAVSDDRIALMFRSNAYLLADAIIVRFGPDGWDCRDIPPNAEHKPMSGRYVNRSCSKSVDGKLLHTESRFFAKAGQRAIDPYSGRINHGQFESSARLEVRQAGAAVDANGRPW